MEKASLREHFRDAVKALSTEERHSQSESIRNQVCKHLSAKDGETWSLYAPLADEPNLLECLKMKPQVNWVFPKVQASGILSFYQVKNKEQLIANSWGLLQPNPQVSEPVSIEQISGFIIPALAYDKFGVRLGRGGGYYDQTLENHPGQKIGVIFEKNFSATPLPKEGHDQLMDFVVTSKTWIQVRGQTWI